MNSHCKRKKNQSGFSLIELVLIIVLIGVLAAIATAKWIDLSASAKTATCKANQMVLETAQRLYYIKNVTTDKPSYASSMDDLLPYLQESVVPRCLESKGQIQLLPDGRVTCILNSHKRTHP